MQNFLLEKYFIKAASVDPGVAPNMDAPWMPASRDLTGMLMGTAIVFLALGIAIGAAVWGFSKFTNFQHGDKGVIGMIICLVAAAIIGSAGAGIRFFSGIPLFG